MSTLQPPVPCMLMAPKAASCFPLTLQTPEDHSPVGDLYQPPLSCSPVQREWSAPCSASMCCPFRVSLTHHNTGHCPSSHPSLIFQYLIKPQGLELPPGKGVGLCEVSHHPHLVRQHPYPRSTHPPAPPPLLHTSALSTQVSSQCLYTTSLALLGTGNMHCITPFASPVHLGFRFLLQLHSPASPIRWRR